MKRYELQKLWLLYVSGKLETQWCSSKTEGLIAAHIAKSSCFTEIEFLCTVQILNLYLNKR